MSPRWQSESPVAARIQTHEALYNECGTQNELWQGLPYFIGSDWVMCKQSLNQSCATVTWTRVHCDDLEISSPILPMLHSLKPVESSVPAPVQMLHQDSWNGALCCGWSWLLGCWVLSAHPTFLKDFPAPVQELRHWRIYCKKFPCWPFEGCRDWHLKEGGNCLSWMLILGGTRNDLSSCLGLISLMNLSTKAWRQLSVLRGRQWCNPDENS